MFIQMLSRFGASLFLVVLVSGCASTVSERSVKCKWVPSSCIHEGSYEPGEEEFAEQEAKDLNRDASKKFRRSAR